MQFGFLTRQIVTGIVAPALAFFPMVGQLEETSNPYESNRPASSSNNPYEKAGSSEVSHSSGKTKHTKAAQPNQKKDTGSPKTGSKQSQNLKKTQSSRDNVGKNKKPKNSNRHSQPHKKLGASTFNVSPKSGSLTTTYTADKVNGLYGLGHALKIAMNYKKGQHSPYLPLERKDCSQYHTYTDSGDSFSRYSCHSDGNWALSFPAIYQTSRLKPTDMQSASETNKGERAKPTHYKRSWVLQFQGATHTFSTLARDFGAITKPLTLKNFYNNFGKKDTKSATQFQYSHLSGNAYTWNHKKGNKFPGANVVITKIDGLNDDDGEIEFHTASNIQYELKRQPDIDFVHNTHSGKSPADPFVLQRMHIPLEKPVTVNGKTIRSQVYHFDYKSKGNQHYTITIRTWGEPAHDSHKDGKIHKNTVAKLDIDIPNHEVTIHTPNYGYSGGSMVNKTTMSKYANESKIALNYKGNITRINTPSGQTIHYDYHKKEMGKKHLLAAITKPNRQILIGYKSIGHVTDYSKPPLVKKPSNVYGNELGAATVRAYPVHQVTYKAWPGGSSYAGGKYKQVTYRYCATASDGPACTQFPDDGTGTGTSSNTFIFPFGVTDNDTYHWSLAQQIGDHRDIKPHGGYWRDALFRYGALEVSPVTNGSDNIGYGYWSASKRQDKITDQHYGTMVQTDYYKAAGNEVNTIMEYHKYDAMGRKVRYSKRTYKDGLAISEIIYGLDYKVDIDDIGVTAKYDNYAALPLYWNKPSKKRTRVYKNGTADGNGKLTKLWHTDHHYTDLGQLKWRETKEGKYGEGGRHISGVYKRYACNLYGNQTTRDLTGMLSFGKNRSKVAYSTHHYWQPAKASNFELGDGYPDTVRKRTVNGLVNHAIDDDGVDDLKDYAGTDHCNNDKPKPQKKPDNSIVTKIAGNHININDKHNWPAIVGHYVKAPKNTKPLQNFSDEITRSSRQMTRQVVTNDATNQNAWLKHKVTKQGQGDHKAGGLTRHYYVNQYGLLRKKVMPTGATTTIDYDFKARKLKITANGEVVKKHQYGHNKHSTRQARTVKVYNVAHDWLIAKHYNPLGKRTTVKHGKPQKNAPFKFKNGFKMASFDYDQAMFLNEVTHHKYGKKASKKVGTRQQKPIRDRRYNRIGMHKLGKALSHVKYGVDTGGKKSGQKINIAFNFHKADSGPAFASHVKLMYRDKYTGAKQKVEKYRAKALNQAFDLNEVFFNKNKMTLRSDAKTKLVNKIQNASVTPYQRMHYNYKQSGKDVAWCNLTGTKFLCTPKGMLDKIKLAYPSAKGSPKVTKVKHAYDKYGQLKHTKDVHGNKAATFQNLLGKTVYHKLTDTNGQTYYLKQAAHNTLGQKIYVDQRRGPSDLNQWKSSKKDTFNHVTFGDSGRAQKMRRANGHTMTYKYNNDQYPSSITGVNLDGDKWRRMKYDKYGFKKQVSQFNPDGSQMIKTVDFNQHHNPHKIHYKLKSIDGMDFSWQTINHYNDAGTVYKIQHQLGQKDQKTYTIDDHHYTSFGRVAGYTIHPPNFHKGIKMTMAYGDQGKLNKVQAKSKRKFKQVYHYNANLQLDKMVSSVINGISTVTLTSQWDRYASGYPSKLTNQFKLDFATNLIKGLSANEKTNTYHYTYNDGLYNGVAGHLTKRKASNQPTESFAYDKLGNITQRSQGQTKPHQYDYNKPFTLKKITQDGQTTRDFTTNPRGRVTKAGKGQTITYTPFGQVQKIQVPVGEGDQSIRFFYGVKGKPIAKKVGDKLAVKIAGGWSKPLSTQKSTAKKFYNHMNWSLPHSLGIIKTYQTSSFGKDADPHVAATLKALNDNIVISGNNLSNYSYRYYQYTAFGKQKKSVPGTDDLAGYHGFKAQRTDQSTGWQYLGGNRLYVPQIGRFLQPDSQSPGKGGINPYRFAHNNPIVHTDPSGHSFLSDLASDVKHDVHKAAHDLDKAAKEAKKIATHPKKDVSYVANKVENKVVNKAKNIWHEAKSDYHDVKKLGEELHKAGNAFMHGHYSAFGKDMAKAGMDAFKAAVTTAKLYMNVQDMMPSKLESNMIKSQIQSAMPDENVDLTVDGYGITPHIGPDSLEISGLKKSGFEVAGHHYNYSHQMTMGVNDAFRAGDNAMLQAGIINKTEEKMLLGAENGAINALSAGAIGYGASHGGAAYEAGWYAGFVGGTVAGFMIDDDAGAEKMDKYAKGDGSITEYTGMDVTEGDSGMENMMGGIDNIKALKSSKSWRAKYGGKVFWHGTHHLITQGLGSLGLMHEL